jgi:hypothetical protein
MWLAQVTFDVYADFTGYKKGVYKHLTGAPSPSACLRAYMSGPLGQD